MSKTTDRASDVFQAARQNQYVNRLIEDADLRDQLLDAVQSARKAYESISDNKKNPVDAISHDRKVQRDLRQAAESLRDATDQLRAPKKRKKKWLGKLIVLTLAAVGITLAVSEDARKMVLDTLFGPEEEFEYTSTTSANGDAS